MAGIRGLKQLRDREGARLLPAFYPEAPELEPVTVYIVKSELDALVKAEKPYAFGRVGLLFNEAENGDGVVPTGHLFDAE